MASVIVNPDRKRIALTVLRHRLRLEILHPDEENFYRSMAHTVSSAKHWLGIPKNKRPRRAKLLELVTKELENYGKHKR